MIVQNASRLSKNIDYIKTQKYRINSRIIHEYCLVSFLFEEFALLEGCGKLPFKPCQGFGDLGRLSEIFPFDCFGRKIDMCEKHAFYFSSVISNASQ